MKAPALTWTASDEILRRSNEGESLYALSAEFNRHPSNVYSLLRRRYGWEAEGHIYWGATVAFPDDPAVLGYIAGIIDGEGCLRRRADGLWTVEVQMTHEPVVDWLHSFGGSTYSYERPPPRKKIHSWRVARRHDALILLKALEPYMIVKQERAREAIHELTTRVEGRTRPSKRV